ncbi:MAG: hypothetical protein M4579_005051 [Chaenotheca gracillima]|nr:MAG: hypothetical protein M4579_005051 [Chaenotheca gracillima]
MAVDNQQRPIGSLGGFDQMHSYASPPQFTNPWASTSSANNSSNLSFGGQTSVGLDALSKQQAARASRVSMPYTSIPVSAPSLPAQSNLPMSYQQDALGVQQDMLNPSRLSSAPSYASEHSYATAPSPNSSAYPSSSASYDAMDYTSSRNPYASQQQHTSQPQQQQSHQMQQQQQQQQQAADRRLSQPALSSNNFLGSPIDAQQRQRQASLVDFNGRIAQAQAQAQAPRESFGDALDAGRGMVAMSQDATPRNIYGPRSSRGSADSYGFPATHSSSSSISSASTYPSYYGSVDSSVSDYSSPSEALDSMPSRTLPRPQALLGGAMPPGPQSMMGQFSSKISSSTQKKHKCKVCDKRFTRPSSLQTHMYSHTGEKPFPCDVDGCGRHFSVVSNLRRHKKVHKGERDPGSGPEDM